MNEYRHRADTERSRRGRHGRRGGRAKLGRLFAHGDLRFLILSLVAEKPRHGYEVIKEIEDRVGGAYSPSPGVIYPTLTLLEELGWVTVSSSEGTRKLHTITEDGELALQANRTTLEAILARMDEARAAHRDDAEIADIPPTIAHARDALKSALRRRLSAAPLSDAQIGTIAAALLTAAATIDNA